MTTLPAREFNTVLQIEPYLTQRETDEKLDRCNELAGWYFTQATKAQRAEYEAEIHCLLGVTGPRADRQRDAAKAKFKAATVEAAALCDRTFDCLVETGEVSQEISYEWDALIAREQVAHAMAAE